MTSGSRWCHQKSGIPDPDRARAGKLFFPFCIIVAPSVHLQTSTGYLRIGLDPGIPTVPKNPDFRFRFGRKIRKTEKTVSARFALLRPNQGTYRHGRGTQRWGLTSGSRWCHQKSGIPDPDRARAGKLVFPFCIIVAQPGHLQTSTGYLRIRLEPRIPTVPKSGFPCPDWPENTENEKKRKNQ